MTERGARLFSRDEVLGGMPARRAASTLFAIENRTARLVVRSRRAVERYVSERAAAHEEHAFLQALAEGREPPLRPAIQDIERHAPDWADLVAEDPALRATIAHQLGAKYRLTRERVPRLRSALGIDARAVAQAHTRQFAQPIDSIYADRLSARERWRWARSRFAERLESLPPTWAAFALTLTETVGAGVLALPIALAGLGVLPALALLVVFGLVNLITIAAIVESINRDGAIRYGTAYFGRLVEDYLGVSGRVVLSVALFVINALTVAAYVIGFGSTLGGFTGSSVFLWVGALFAATILVLRRETLDATVATAMLIGFTNIALLVGIGTIGLLNTDVGRVLATPTITAATVPLVFGVLLTAYFGHTSAGTAAKLVLSRDPTGRSLLRGNVAAMAVAIGLYAFVLLGVNGAVSADALVGYGGTSIEPLARVAGPSVRVLGGAFVMLAMGLATIMCSLGLYNQAREVAPQGIGGWRLPVGRGAEQLIAASPVVAVFLVVVVMLATNQASFSGPIAIVGTLAVPVLGGVLPMLMLLAARRRGEYVPSDAPRALGHPLTVAGVSGLFGAGVIVQGALIWQDPLARVLTALVAILIAGLCVRAARSGAFRPRSVLEIRGDARGDRLRYSLVSEGHAAVTTVRAIEGRTERQHTGPSGSLDGRELRSATFTIPPRRELSVWAHRVTDEADSIPLAFAVSAGDAAGARELGTTDASGRVTIVLPPGCDEIAIRRLTEKAAPNLLGAVRTPTADPLASALVAGGEFRS